ncbi:hypothetical protein [Loktanella sp. 3ANDIMAR09]|uniref:hypothetical protein n=1 Tax=Loktanella sp. 3ANDIMAR09 TaxID=1225657 RepID=UPI000A53F822|nr:hypothetical protein [Loktanella sp. 3ANDIMAR09]
MKKAVIFAVGMSLFPQFLAAQDAFVAQVGDLRVSTTAPVSQQITVASIQASVPTVMPDRAGIAAGFDDSLLPAVADARPYANVAQTGTNHSASITQGGLHAALIQQTGMGHMATITQTGGTMNRAAIIQASSNATAGISQFGSRNRALIIQN